MFHRYIGGAQDARRRGLALCLALLSSPVLFAQQVDILPSLAGEQLQQALATEFKPDYTFGYDRARDSLFAAVFYEDGTVYCVYTGWPISIDRTSNTSPRTQANDQGVNTEHTWPQSMGAGSGSPRSNLHHLYPTRADANSSRSNHPFADLAPAVVTRWWYMDFNQASTPGGDLSVWSRTAGSLPAFEPRDDHKGRVARAMFYFYTIYRAEADAESADFFNAAHRETLYRWHYTYPPDELEYSRNHLIASYQSGAVNPFISDTTLIRRAYFDGTALPGVTFDAIYTFDGTVSCADQQNAVTAEPSGVDFSEFVRQGVTCNQGANVFNSNSWPESATVDESRFVAFSVTAETGLGIDLGDGAILRFQTQRSPTGPGHAEVRISIDGGQFQPVGEWAAGTTLSTHQFALPDVGGASTVEFRFYGWAASSSAGTMRFDNVRLIGRVAPIQELRAILQGAIQGDEMRTTLADQGLIPLGQPYWQEPWGYSGREAVSEIPEGVVDWILVEVYSGEADESALVREQRQAAFLRADGRVTGLDGFTPIQFDGLSDGEYHILVRHRNHVPVISALPVAFRYGRASYDFTSGTARAYGGRMALTENGARSALWAGDATGDGQVTAGDFNAFLQATTSGATGYVPGDLNLDGQVTAVDFNLFLQATVSGAEFVIPAP